VLLPLALVDLHQPVWPAGILDELQRNLGTKVSEQKAMRLRNVLDRHFPDSRIAGYEPLVPAMTCDPRDRHVLALAVPAQAGTLVANNVKDFPPRSAVPHDVSVNSADGFALGLFRPAPDEVLRALTRQAGRMRRPPTTVIELLEELQARQCLPGFATDVCQDLARTGRY